MFKNTRKCLGRPSVSHISTPPYESDRRKIFLALVSVVIQVCSDICFVRRTATDRVIFHPQTTNDTARSMII